MITKKNTGCTRDDDARRHGGADGPDDYSYSHDELHWSVLQKK